MTKIDILAGKKSIGGNFIKIIDRDRVLIFDQGIRFDIFRRYFAQSIQPSGVMELRHFGIIPAEDWYNDSNDIYITHLHLDHLGALSNVPQEIQVHLPGLSIYHRLKEKWESSPTWLNFIPENYYLKVDNVQVMVEDKNRVLAIPVSHSAYPSVAYLYFGSDKTILYTGDIRVNGFLDDKGFRNLHKNALTLDSYLEREHDLKIDILLLEGTNFGSDRTPISPAAACETMKKIMTSSDLVLITCHYLDYEFILAALSIAKLLEFKAYLTSEIVANALQEINSQLDVRVLEEFSITPHFDTEKLEETLNEKSLYIISYNDILDILRSFDKELFSKKNIACILTEPEPSNEEMMEYDPLGRWLSLFNIHPYRLRVSGHYYPFELQEIVNKIKFREFIPIHTTYPEIMRKHINHYFSKMHTTPSEDIQQ